MNRSNLMCKMTLKDAEQVFRQRQHTPQRQADRQTDKMCAKLQETVPVGVEILIICARCPARSCSNIRELASSAGRAGRTACRRERVARAWYA